MTLRSQLIQFFKSLNGAVLGVQLQQEKFQTSKGGYFSSESIIRTARVLEEEGRLEKHFDDKNLVMFQYKPSKFETFHQNIIKQESLL